MRHFTSSNFRHVTDNWELTVKAFILKWEKENETATSYFRYISEAIEKALKNSPYIGFALYSFLVNKGKRVT